MIYIRGQKEDYEAWAAMGNPDWGYEQVLPFFRRAEANERLHHVSNRARLGRRERHFFLSGEELKNLRTNDGRW